MRALLVDEGRDRGYVAAARALEARGWWVAAASCVGPSLTARTRSVRAWHQIADERAAGPDAFVESIDELVRRERYDVVFVGWERGIAAVSERRSSLSFPIGYGPHQGVMLAIDKARMAAVAARCGLTVPPIVPAQSGRLGELVGAIVIKPASQVEASVAAALFEDRDRALEYAHSIEQQGGRPIAQLAVHGVLIALAVVAGPEGVVSISQQVAEHSWPRPVGVTVRGLTVPVDPVLRAGVERLLEELSWQGLAQLQFLVPAGGLPHLIDFNPRFYGSIALAIRAGANHPDSWGRLMLGLPVCRMEARAGVRYQWLSRDLRASLSSEQPARELARCLMVAPTAAHSLWSWREPLLAPTFLAEQLGRAATRSLPRSPRFMRDNPAETVANARMHGLSESAGSSALRSRRVPPAPVRAAQRIAMKAGQLKFEEHWLAALQTARKAALGPNADRAPRFLVRVDEFPYYSGFDNPKFGYEASARFHSVMAEAGVAHLLAVVPQWTHDALNPSGTGGRRLDERDVALLEQMRWDGVTFAQHGATHRTRYTDPRRQSELCGLDDAALGRLLDGGRAVLEAIGISPRVLVPPFNRFDARQWPALASRYDVITGGPESVRLIGFHGGPLWRGEAVYLPCYAPLYDSAAKVLAAVQVILSAGIGGWIPIVLHMGWELDDDCAALARLTRVIAAYAADWDKDFLPVVSATRPQKCPGSSSES